MCFWSPVLNQLETFVLRTDTDLQSPWKNQFSVQAWHKQTELCTYTLQSCSRTFNVTIFVCPSNPKQACSPAVPNCSTHQVYEHCIRNANIFLHLGKHWHRKLFFLMLTAGSLNKSSVSPRVGGRGKNSNSKNMSTAPCHRQRHCTCFPQVWFAQMNLTASGIT